MGQLKKKDKKGHDEVWEWEETPEVKEALKKLWEQDNKLGYDTSGK